MKYICVHGHFYQPPRENPSLEAVELQDSAYPYHDWNERVTAECYAPNATSRLFDQLILAYGDKAKNVFTSSDGKHRIYALSND